MASGDADWTPIRYLSTVGLRTDHGTVLDEDGSTEAVFLTVIVNGANGETEVGPFLIPLDAVDAWTQTLTATRDCALSHRTERHPHP